MKLLFSIEELKGFYRKELEYGIYSGGFERWLNTSHYSLVSDGMYEYTYQRDRDKVSKQIKLAKDILDQTQLAIKEIKNCMSIAELQRTGL